MTTRFNPHTIESLAGLLGCDFRGDASHVISGIASPENASERDLVFVASKELVEKAAASNAGCLIIPVGESIAGRNVIEAKNPKLAFSIAARNLLPPVKRDPMIHPSAVVAKSARVSPQAYVGPNVQIGENSEVGDRAQLMHSVYVGNNVALGEDCVLHPGVVLYDNVSISDRVVLHAGVVIGADGFGYVRGPEGYEKFPQVGNVVIEQDVEIGALTCIDRAALGHTRIGRGTKIDNLVQIAHNVEIGARVVIAAQTGISGSTVIEDDAVIGGQVGMGDHARVQSGAVIGSQAGVLPGKIVRPGVWWGTPVQPLDEYKRINAHVNRLPKMREEIGELKRQVAELSRKLNRREDSEREEPGEN